MKKCYNGNCVTVWVFLFVLLAAVTISASAQTVTITPVYSNHNFIIQPGALNVDPGTNTHIIGLMRASLSAGPLTVATISSVTITTAGTYGVSDIKPNGFKLWFVKSYAIDYNSLTQSALLASAEPVASGQTIVFANLEQQLATAEQGVFYITADIAETAIEGNTVHLAATPLSNIVLASGIVTGEPVPASSPQTFVRIWPEISFYANLPSWPYPYSPGSFDNLLYYCSLTISKKDDVLQSVTLPILGTATPDDIAPSGFKLWYADGNSSNFERVMAGSAELTEAGNVVFSNLQLPLNRKQSGFGNYLFFVTVDLAPGAIIGRTVGVGEFPLTNLNFLRAQGVSGPATGEPGLLHPIAAPTVALSSSGPEAGAIGAGNAGNVLYKLNLNVSNANAVVSRVSFRTEGTYQPTDVTRFRLVLAPRSDQAVTLATVAPVASGNDVVFNLTNEAMFADRKDIALHLVADMAEGAVAGRTIQVEAVAPANVTLVSGEVTGSTSAGGVQTITVPSVAFTPAGPAAGNIRPGNYAVLHTVRVDVTDVPATLESVAFMLSGTFQSSDFGRVYPSQGPGLPGGVEGAYLIYNNTPLVAENLQYLDYHHLSYSSLAAVPVVPAAGNQLQFSFAEGVEKAVLPVGTGYISLVVFVNEQASLNHTIRAGAEGTAGYRLVAGTTTGAIGTGAVQTINTPSVRVTAIPAPAQPISLSALDVVVYKIKMETSLDNIRLTSLRLPTSGTYALGAPYSLHDVDFVLYHSADTVLGRYSDKFISYIPQVTGDKTFVFNFMEPLPIRKDSASYLLVVASIGYEENIPGRTFRVEEIPASAFTFVGGPVSGNFPLPASGVHTIIRPNPQVAMPAVPALNLAGGSNNNILHKIAVTSTDAALYPNTISFKLYGTYHVSEIADPGLKIWFNTTDSFTGSRMISAVGKHVNGADFVGIAWGTIIPPGTTGYFFITADIVPIALPGRTLQVEIDYFYFNGGRVTLPANTRSPVHTFSQAQVSPVYTVTYPEVASGAVAPGSADNVVYRFNVAPIGTDAYLNYLGFKMRGTYTNTDLVQNGLKLWYNTSNTFTGSSLVHAFASNGGERDSVNAVIPATRINAGNIGYFFITATVSPDAPTGRTIRLYELSRLQFAFGATVLSSSSGNVFTIGGTPLSISTDIESSNMLVYPNPYREQETLTIETNSNHPKRVVIYSATGKVIASKEMTQITQLTLSNLSKGLYLIQVQHLKDNKVEVKKLLVQ